MAEQKDQGKSVSNDVRFARIHTDPRFRLPRKKALRGTIDDRFKSALDADERFTSGAKTDKYGRKLARKGIRKELEHYYNFEQSSNSDDSSASTTAKKDSMRERMRGEDASDLSSSSDEGSSEDEVEGTTVLETDERDLLHGAQGDIPEGDTSHRLALVNMDWDNISAVDLMATFSSFLPATGRIVSVKIYPSEYGKKRLSEEAISGPPRDLFDAKSSDNEQTVGDDDDRDFNSSKLRRYQLQRLQYYYAIVDCDTAATASVIYDQCDGTEYESTANFFDIRYVPDDVTFDEKPRDECTQVPVTYRPNEFITDALQHSKVKLTWDETPKERTRLVSKAFSQKDLDEIDVRAYLASDSDADDDAAAKYRALLGQNQGRESRIDENESDVDMEITFNPPLEGKRGTVQIIDAQPTDTGLEIDNLTTIEKYRLKEKERRRKRLEKYKARKEEEEAHDRDLQSNSRAELELLAMDDDPTKENASQGGQKHHKLTRTAAKKKAQAAAEESFDVEDTRFRGLFEDPDFAIDATAPQYKKTKAMDQVLQERRKRQTVSSGARAPKKFRHGPQDDVQSLVKKLKGKQNPQH